MPKLGLAKINAFDVDTHGFFFWNFRTELEPKWDYQQAVAAGWLPTAVERESYEYVDKLDTICTAHPSDPVQWNSFLLLVLLLLVMLWGCWQVLKCCCTSVDRRGYTAITGTSAAAPSPMHVSI